MSFSEEFPERRPGPCWPRRRRPLQAGGRRSTKAGGGQQQLLSHDARLLQEGKVRLKKDLLLDQSIYLEASIPCSYREVNPSKVAWRPARTRAKQAEVIFYIQNDRMSIVYCRKRQIFRTFLLTPGACLFSPMRERLRPLRRKRRPS